MTTRFAARRWRSLVVASVAALAGVFASCEKVPIVDIGAQFGLADATWFADEETLFFFYSVSAQQGLSSESQIEVTYRTDDLFVPWTRVSSLPQVHPHVPVDCGPTTLCGSASVHVTSVPRDVGLRLKYHRNGQLAAEANVTSNVVGSGPAYANRSLVLYGVFDATNTHVQWRARHQFPTLRNAQVQQLGLRRPFRVEAAAFGDSGEPFTSDNPYGYAFADQCPSRLTPLSWAEASTDTRAIFAPEALPLEASGALDVCAKSTVHDAKGDFVAPVVAYKNPEVRAAFPSLRSPVKPAVPLGFLLKPCETDLAPGHEALQTQRLLLSDPTVVCIDHWRDPQFLVSFVATLRSKIEEARPQGHDLVLTLALHHDDSTGQFAEVVEAALDDVLPFERDKSSPRVSGAFVYDTFAHRVANPMVTRLALWCPSDLDAGDLGQVNDVSQRSCPLLPDRPDLVLGPFKFSQLPILPSRPQYENFVAKYSEGQTGTMKELKFLAPERTPTSENVLLGDFGVATFFNNETLPAQPGDAFSYCDSANPLAMYVVFRTAAIPGTYQLSTLGEFHTNSPQPLYGLGLGWDSPFLLRMTYEAKFSGALTALSFTVPFGIANSQTQYFGTPVWETGEVSLAETLKQCTRFCEHPTFDSAGVYNVTADFRSTYARQCYQPVFPSIETSGLGGGYPLDP